MADTIYDIFDRGLYRVGSSTYGTDLPANDVSGTSISNIDPSQINSGGASEQTNVYVGALVSGKQGFNNSQTGYILGVDAKDGIPKFYIGNTTNYLNWDGTTLTISGNISATTGTIGGFNIGADYIRDVANSFGMASTVTGGDDVRFWAGDTFANRATAPLRIYESGIIVGTSATFTGTLNATGGYIGSTTALIYEAQGINTGTTGHIRGGQTDYNTGVGYFLGYSGGQYKLSFGDPSADYITWDGSTLTISGVQTVLKRFTADQNLTAGNPVGISNLLDSNVAKALLTMPTANNNITTALIDSSSARQQLFAPIGANKFAYLQYTAATSDTLFAQVASIDKTTQTPTLGTAVAVATNFTPNSAKNITICKLDTDKFIVIYLLDASTTVIKYRIGTVSGTTITFGTEATFATAGSTVATSESFGADFISTDKGVFYFKANTATNSRIFVFTASGTVATIGTGVQPGTNSDNNVTSFVKTIGTDKFVLVTHSTANSVYAQVGTCSGGTTITNGTEVQISTATSAERQNAMQVVSPASDVFVATFPSTTTAQNVVACTVSGTTPTAGTTVLLTASVSSNASVGIYAQSSSLLYLFYNGNSNERSFKISLSSTTITSGGVVIYGSDIPPADGVIAIDAGYFCFVGMADVTKLTFFFQGIAYNFLGFAQSTVARSATVQVAIAGVDSNQSGLTAGTYYQVTNGALTIIDPSAASTRSINGLQIVKAISTTQVII